tara:strand:+ start:148 stop:483 length:336 start_codon:yes stop_codon:yes gene_type:complete
MNLGVSGEVVAYLADPVVQGEIDDLLSSAATPSSGLMSRLVSLGWKADSEVAALLLGLNLFVHYYNKERDDYGTEIPQALDIAYASTINHPVVSKLIAAKTGAAIDGAAGV